MACTRKLDLKWINAEHLEDTSKESAPQQYYEAWSTLHQAHGILVPGGFGQRGIEGMIAAAHLARTKNIPYLGICLGMQIAVIEFARNVAGFPQAGSVEFDEHCKDPVVVFMPEIDPETMGGNMRLGLRETHFQPGTEWSKLRALYEAEKPISNDLASNSFGSLTNGTEDDGLADGEAATRPAADANNDRQLDGTTSEKPPLIVLERHRHRYEVSPSYISPLLHHGLQFVGKDRQGERMEILELKDHPWFVGVQFHPEYLSRVLRPSKPYLGFVASAVGCFKQVERRTRERKGSVGWGMNDVAGGGQGEPVAI